MQPASRCSKLTSGVISEWSVNNDGAVELSYCILY